MNIRSNSSLIILIIICYFTFNNVIAQKHNRIGIGYNLSFTKGYSSHLIGLKLYYEKKLFSNVSFKGNLDLILPDELVQFPIETTLLYKINSKHSFNQFFFGFGIGYYLIADNSNRHYYYENNVSISYIPFDEGLFGVHILSGMNNLSENISFELKYAFLSANQDETLFFTALDSFSKKRIKRINLNTLRISLSYYFDL